MSDHDFCLQILVAVRKEARAADERTDRGWDVLESTNVGPNKYFVVQDELGCTIWEGRACCRYAARHDALVNFLKMEQYP